MTTIWQEHNFLVSEREEDTVEALVGDLELEAAAHEKAISNGFQQAVSIQDVGTSCTKLVLLKLIQTMLCWDRSF